MSSKTMNYFLVPRKTNCFLTFDVFIGAKIIGGIQQVDASSGITSHTNPRNLWLIWVGDPDKDPPDGPGAHPTHTREDAILYILQAHRDGE